MKRNDRYAGWLLGEIEGWEAEGVITAEAAALLKSRYQPKKKAGLLRILFTVIGTLFIGMGVIMIGAHNLWYKLPIFIRTIIAFLPLTGSQALLFYVYRRKMHSTASREGAAILNMAGVFSSIAIVGQVFHLPGDFTGYALCCGMLSLPSMAAMNAVAPLGIYYWAVLNGGAFLEGPWGMAAMLALYGTGAAFAVHNFRPGGGRALYAAWITIIAGYAAVIIAAVKTNCEMTVILLGCLALTLALANRWEGLDMPFKIVGAAGALIMMSFFTYSFMWEYSYGGEAEALALTAALTAAAFFMGAKSLAARRCPMLTAVMLLLLSVRMIFSWFGLGDGVNVVAPMLFSNAVMLATGVYYIWSGARRAELLPVNMGMASVCILIVLRFFDSDLPLSARGAVFLLLGTGFLAVNRRMLKMKKSAGEGT